MCGEEHVYVVEMVWLKQNVKIATFNKNIICKAKRKLKHQNYS